MGAQHPGDVPGPPEKTRSSPRKAGGATQRGQLGTAMASTGSAPSITGRISLPPATGRFNKPIMSPATSLIKELVTKRWGALRRAACRPWWQGLGCPHISHHLVPSRFRGPLVNVCTYPKGRPQARPLGGFSEGLSPAAEGEILPVLCPQGRLTPAMVCSPVAKGLRFMAGFMA